MSLWNPLVCCSLGDPPVLANPRCQIVIDDDTGDCQYLEDTSPCEYHTEYSANDVMAESNAWDNARGNFPLSEYFDENRQPVVYPTP